MGPQMIEMAGVCPVSPKPFVASFDEGQIVVSGEESAFDESSSDLRSSLKALLLD